MGREIEARLLEVDEKTFLEKLNSLGATFVGDWIQIRKLYDFTPKKQNSWIRLRTNGDKTTLTIKEIENEKIDGTKEWEIEVSDFDTTCEILAKMGYMPRSTQENRRIRFMLDSVEIDIDFWPLIPTYVEFEAESEEAVKLVCEKLQVEFNKLVTLDVTSIYEHYGIPFDSLPAIIELEDERKQLKF